MSLQSKLLNFLGYKQEKIYEDKAAPPANYSDPENSYFNRYGGSFQPIYTEPYTGEKNLDQLGPIKNYVIDHAALAARSRQFYVESEVAKTIVDRFTLWIVGSGLKLQAEPATDVLAAEGVNEDARQVANLVEPYWRLFTNSATTSHNKEKNLHEIANEATKTAMLSGDCLIIGRLRGNNLTFQAVDGQFLRNPNGLPNETKLKNNNRVISGVEVNAAGRHVAYHVADSDNYYGTKRIEAYGRQTKLRFAWLITGVKYRNSDVRGIPVLSATLESLKKLDRYKEATVGAAEEQSKIAYQITHETGSGEQNVFAQKLTDAVDLDRNSGDDLASSYEGKDLESKVAGTAEKQAVNMPEGSEIKPMQNGNGQTQFKEFYHTQIEMICAAAGIPYEVAVMMYNSNYSASRAALKDWEHTLSNWQNHLANNFYYPVYKLWLIKRVIENKIQLPAFLNALLAGNEEISEAYCKARWVGKSVPHIDPVKEVEAVRRALGSKAKHLPLTTASEATERLNFGEYLTNVNRYGQELEQASNAGIEPEQETGAGRPAENNFEEEDQ